MQCERVERAGRRSNVYSVLGSIPGHLEMLNSTVSDKKVSSTNRLKSGLAGCV